LCTTKPASVNDVKEKKRKKYVREEEEEEELAVMCVCAI
jgi:hypothetical protein